MRRKGCDIASYPLPSHPPPPTPSTTSELAQGQGECGSLALYAFVQFDSASLFMFPNSISYLRVHFKLNTQTASGVIEMFSVRVSTLFKGNVILARILNLFKKL